MTKTCFQVVSSVQDIRPHVADFPQDSIVFLDVDNTIIQFRDKILRPFDKGSLELPINRVLYDSCQISKIHNQAEQILIDPEWPGFIQDLKDRDICVLAVTAIPAFDDCMIYRINELAQLGIHFHDERWQNFPEFRKGILFTGSHKKGRMMESFLEAQEYNPHQLAMIDDQKHNLESVAEKFPKATCLHFQADLALSEFDLSRSEWQIAYFECSNLWVSDIEYDAMPPEERTKKLEEAKKNMPPKPSNGCNQM